MRAIIHDIVAVSRLVSCTVAQEPDIVEVANIV